MQRDPHFVASKLQGHLLALERYFGAMGGTRPQAIQKNTSHLLDRHRDMGLALVSRLLKLRRRSNERHGTHPDVLERPYETHVDQIYNFEALSSMAF